MLDPELVNLLTFANTAQNRQLSQQQVQLLNKLLAEAEREAKKPKCPACGGALEVSFRKCKHCATDLSWIDGHPCEPGQEETLKATLRKIREHKREEQARKARQSRIASEERKRGKEELASARHILVKDEALCVDLKQQIVDGADFADIAKEHSQCPSGRDGGALGEFGRGQMVPEFDEVVFTGEVNVVHGPVQTQFGFHLLEVTSRTD